MEIKKIGLILALASSSSLVNAEIRIGVVTSSSGPIAMVGIPQKNSIALLPKTIGGEAVKYSS